MVFDKQRLPRVLVRGVVAWRFLAAGGRAAHARPVDLRTSIASSQHDPERSGPDARHVDLNRRPESVPAAATERRVAAPTWWSRRARDAVRPHDARRVVTRDAI